MIDAASIRVAALHTARRLFDAELHGRVDAKMLGVTANHLGFPLPRELMYGIWNSEKMWKDCGSRLGAGYDAHSGASGHCRWRKFSARSRPASNLAYT